MAEEASTVEGRIEAATERHRAGDLREAVRRYRAILDEQPDRPRVWSMLGHALMQVEGDAPALECFRRAAELAPERFVFHYMLARCQERLGRLEAAAGSLDAACDLDPPLLEVHEARLRVHRTLGDEPGAARAWSDLDAALPDDATEADRLSREREQSGQRRDALLLAQRAADLEPGPAERWTRLAELREQAGDAEGALEAHQNALARDPEAPGVAAAIVRLCERLGRLDEARWYAGAALERDPRDPDLNLVLARLDRRDGNLPAARTRLEPQLANQRITSKWTYASILTELGRTLDAMDRFDEAFGRFAEAQRVLASRTAARRMDAEAYPAWLTSVARQPAQSPGSHDAPGRMGKGANAPVFIVGLPGAGVERIAGLLARHPRLAVVEGGGPLGGIARKAEALLGESEPGDSPSPERIESLRAAHAEEARVRLGVDALGERRVVEASALNLPRLAMIARLFPDSPVIVALRDPRDACLACFFDVLTPTAATVHFHELESAARVLGGLVEVYRRQRPAAGANLLEIRYEDLVADEADAARRLFAFIYEQPPEPAQAEVGGGVGLDELPPERWAGYAKHLAPVRETLDPLAREFGYA